ALADAHIKFDRQEEQRHDEAGDENRHAEADEVLTRIAPVRHAAPGDGSERRHAVAVADIRTFANRQDDGLTRRRDVVVKSPEHILIGFGQWHAWRYLRRVA